MAADAMMAADWSGNVELSFAFTYDARGRLVNTTSNEEGQSHNETYVYNSDGIRVRANRDGVERRFIIDAANPTGYAQVLEERNTSNTATRSYVIGADVLAQADSPTTVRRLLYDAHGSTRALLNATTFAEQYDYTAYGVPLFNQAAAQTNLLYSGEYTELATGQQNLRARVYDPTFGRFLSMDSFSGYPDFPLTLARYVYGWSDPIQNSDPSGHFTLAGASVGNFIGEHLDSLQGELGQIVLDSVERRSTSFRAFGFQIAALGIGPLVAIGSGVVDDLFERVTFLWRSNVVDKYRASADDVARVMRAMDQRFNDLATAARRRHILHGDATGGGHLWPEKPGKTPFPIGWDENKNMNAVSDTATDPAVLWKRQDGKTSFFYKSGKPARFTAVAERGGVRIKVIIEPAGEGIITAHPAKYS